ncbi:MAG: efflux RND transporter periplasmic adaptor subunit [Bryobacteraceae bacterium]|nr:efflux RND transporter periplasmic adaptor subunit [Bryobacteraceae bacterium]
MKRLLVIIVVIGVAGFIGYRVWDAYQAKQVADGKGTKGKGSGKKGAQVVSVGVAQVRQGQVREEIAITGSLRPKEQVDVTAKVTGRVELIRLNVGDRVKVGDLVAVLEDSEIQQQVRRATASQEVVRATLEQRRAELANAQADLERSRQLMEGGLIPRQEYESKQTSFRVVQAQVQLTQAQGEQAQAELNELRIRLEQMKIVSPIDGIVAERFVDVGAVISPSTPVIRVVNLSTLITRANVPEREVAKLRLGNRAQVVVDAFGDQTFEGKVSRISPVMDAATRSALVEVEILNRDGGLRAEMFARVTLDLGTMRPAVLIPREAMVYRGQQAGVFVLSGNRPTFREIEPGVPQGNDVEVLANLPVGTTIVSKGAAMVSEGVNVQISGDDRPVTAQPGPQSKNRKEPLRADLKAVEGAGTN